MLNKLFNFKALKLKWHQLYYVLAVIDILTILAALFLTQTLMNNYESSVKENRKMSLIVSEFIKLGYIAQSVNEPGNRIFDTKDVVSETTALEQNKLWFDTAFNHAQRNIHESFSTEQSSKINLYMQQIQQHMELMVNKSYLIFSAIKKEDLTSAGENMAAMDSYYYQVTQTIGDASQYIADIQNIYFEQQIAKTKEIKRYEIGISVIVFLIIGFVTVYGHKLGKKLKANAIEIEKALVDAQQSAKAKEMFLANMSHEIRTPMNAILGMLKLVDNKDLSKDNANYLNIASSSAENLLVIINDILNLSKSDNNQFELEELPFNICQLVDAQIALYRHTNTEQNITLLCDTSQVSKPWLKGDYNRLLQVINNLLNNAFKFTEQGEIKVIISTSIEQENIRLRIVVEDTGIGIDPNKLETIFDVFTQGDASTTRQFGGTGLGLTISKNICHQMKGDLTASSQLAKGSTFTLDVLFKACEVEEEKVIGATEIDQDKEKTFQALGLHLLIAEDNRVNQILLKKVLDNMGCSYDIANNGQEALDMLNPQHDAVLMDCLMPVLDGFEATKSIRALGNNLHNVPIIAVTANSMPDDQQKCLEAGMNFYVSKPIEFNKLYQQLQNVKYGVRPSQNE